MTYHLKLTPTANFSPMMQNCIKTWRIDLENLQDFEMIQNDIDRLCQWTIKWLMFFNVNKCKILHIGKENPNFD